MYKYTSRFVFNKFKFEKRHKDGLLKKWRVWPWEVCLNKSGQTNFERMGARVICVSSKFTDTGINKREKKTILNIL